MIHGIDTGFLVAAEVTDHPDHGDARTTLSRLLAKEDRVALAPQVLAEFIHVVTDPRRFGKPLEMSAARQLAQQWWTAQEVDHIYPSGGATYQFLQWLEQFHLGRKRLLDTLLAATYHDAGIGSLLTTNPNDFAIFGCFAVLTPGNGTVDL